MLWLSQYVEVYTKINKPKYIFDINGRIIPTHILDGICKAYPIPDARQLMTLCMYPLIQYDPFCRYNAWSIIIYYFLLIITLLFLQFNILTMNIVIIGRR